MAPTKEAHKSAINRDLPGESEHGMKDQDRKLFPWVVGAKFGAVPKKDSEVQLTASISTTFLHPY